MRDKPGAGTWAQIGAGVIGLGSVGIIVGLTVQGATTQEGETLELWANPWFLGGVIVAGIGAVIVASAAFSALRGKTTAFRYTADVQDGRHGSKTLRLARSDGEEVGYATVLLFLKGQPVGEPESQKSGRIISYQYPREFKGVPTQPPDVGKYRGIWYVSVRGANPLIEKQKRVRQISFRISEGDREEAARKLRQGTYVASAKPLTDRRVELTLKRHDVRISWVKGTVRQHLPDGSMGPESNVYPEPEDNMEVSVVFPDDFRRTIRETRRPTGAGMRVQRVEEPPAAEPGQYEIIWKEVSYVTGGTFAINHEIAEEEFRREREVAKTYFVVPES